MNQRDPLIGLGNRLHAANLLSALQPAGDDVLCSTWIGSAVNDSDGGHASDAVLRQLGDYLLTSDGGLHGLACKRALTTPQPCAASSTRAGLILPCMATPTREAARARRPAECRLRSGQRSARQLPSRTQQLLALLGALAVLGLGLPEHRDEFDDLVDTDRIGLHERSVGTDRIRPSLAVEDPGWVGSC
jgi:hypothetical protein